MDTHIKLNSISKDLYNKIWDDCDQNERIEVFKKYEELNNE